MQIAILQGYCLVSRGEERALLGERDTKPSTSREAGMRSWFHLGGADGTHWPLWGQPPAGLTRSAGVPKRFPRGRTPGSYGVSCSSSALHFLLIFWELSCGLRLSECKGWVWKAKNLSSGSSERRADVLTSIAMEWRHLEKNEHKPGGNQHFEKWPITRRALISPQINIVRLENTGDV